MTREEKLNCFMVETFNGILRNEERTLCRGELSDLTMSELHVIECVCKSEGSIRMSDAAEQLGKTQGTLTVAVQTLVKKGYLLRKRSPQDGRIILLQTTDRGREANKRHEQYHKQLVASITSRLNEEQLQALCEGLEALTIYFKGEH